MHSMFIGTGNLCCNQVLPNSVLAGKHFQEQGHNFNKHAKFFIIDKLVNLHGGSKEILLQEQGHNFNKHAKFFIIDKLVNLHDSKETLREILVVRENCWIQKLKTLVPFGLNQELSK